MLRQRLRWEKTTLGIANICRLMVRCASTVLPASEAMSRVLSFVRSGYSSVLCVPVSFGGAIVGCVLALNKQTPSGTAAASHRRDFTDNDVSAVSMLCATIGAALMQLRQLEATRQRAESLQTELEDVKLEGVRLEQELGVVTQALQDERTEAAAQLEAFERERQEHTTELAGVYVHCVLATARRTLGITM
jgi:GAF domain-containing protein